MEHVLKIKDEYYEAVASGFKRFEIRKDDRGYQVGDTIRFTDLDGNQRRGVWAITYILRDCPQYGLKEGYAILGIDNGYGGTINFKAADNTVKSIPTYEKGWQTK